MAERIKFHFIKSPNFQEIPAHGAFGGLTPTGDRISVGFYSERQPIPTAIVHDILETGALGDEVEGTREGRDGVVRIVHAVMYFDLTSARSMHEWLGQKVAELEKALEK